MQKKTNTSNDQSKRSKSGMKPGTPSGGSQRTSTGQRGTTSGSSEQRHAGSTMNRDDREDRRNERDEDNDE